MNKKEEGPEDKHVYRQRRQVFFVQPGNCKKKKRFIF
jgi:hypothetical protein